MKSKLIKLTENQASWLEKKSESDGLSQQAIITNAINKAMDRDVYRAKRDKRVK